MTSIRDSAQITDLRVQNPGDWPGQQPLIVSVEGLAGCGKSSTIQRALGELKRMGPRCVDFKLGGLGESRRGRALKRIRAARQEAYLTGTETDHQRDDRKRGRVYALALLDQARELKELITHQAIDVVLLDRSPFMNSVHLRAEAITAGQEDDSSSDEVFEQELAVAQWVGIDEVMLLDVSAEVAFARLIYRYCGADLDQIAAVLGTIEAPSIRKAAIAEHVMRLCEQTPDAAPQPLDNWHLATPIDVIDVERREFVRSLRLAEERIGLAWTVVDAYAKADALAETVIATVQSRYTPGNLMRLSGASSKFT